MIINEVFPNQSLRCFVCKKKDEEANHSSNGVSGEYGGETGLGEAE